MNHVGHVGLTLLIFSFLALPFGFSENAVILIVLAAGLSSLPDIDIRFEIKHRTYTHNIFAALIFGIVFGFILFYAGGLLWGIIGFAAAFGGTMSHLLGDIIAGKRLNGSPWEIKPLWPFSDKLVGFGWFYASDKKMNERLMKMGTLAFVFYLLVTTGVLQEIFAGL